MTPLRMWIGLVLLAIGTVGILEAVGVDTGGVVNWWPIAVIGLGVVAMFGRRRVSAGPLIIVALGFVLLADQQSWTSGNLFGPVLVAAIGLAVLTGLRRSYGNPRDDVDNSFAVFGGARVTDCSEHLTQAGATAVFGGVTLDLREAGIDESATVDAVALFGSVDILVPWGWRIAMTGTPFLGGFEDKTHSDGFLPPDAPVLEVNALAIFGAVTVANESADDRKFSRRD